MGAELKGKHVTNPHHGHGGAGSQTSVMKQRGEICAGKRMYKKTIIFFRAYRIYQGEEFFNF